MANHECFFLCITIFRQHKYHLLRKAGIFEKGPKIKYILLTWLNKGHTTNSTRISILWNNSSFFSEWDGMVIYVTCSHWGRSRKDRTVRIKKKVRCWETSFGGNAMVFGVHMYQAWTPPNHPFFKLYIIIYIYIFNEEEKMEDDKQVINKLYSFCKIAGPGRQSSHLSCSTSCVGHHFQCPLTFHRRDGRHGISMGSPWWKGAIKEAVGVSRI